MTPILSGGFGGAFFSRRLGAYGRWTAGGGLMFAIGERLTAGFGMDVEGLLPRDRYARNFECRLSQQQCAMGLAPWVSFGFRL
ncbi:MAG: hypothetical protein K0V04_17430 [Deltaproteobacteria bacterium]|nr:hypothetical protein [Deltaproteobacteria bacterium]